MQLQRQCRFFTTQRPSIRSTQCPSRLQQRSRSRLAVKAILDSTVAEAVTQQATAFAIVLAAEAAISRSNIPEADPGRPSVPQVAAGIGGTLAAAALVGNGGGLIPTIGLVGFTACKTGEKYSEATSTLRYVNAANIKVPEKPVAEPAPAQGNNNNEKKNEAPKEEKKPAQRSLIVEMVEQPLVAGPAVGECHQYVEGDSGLTLCLQSAEEGVVHGFLYNSGTKDICNLKLETTGAAKGAVKDFWPDWAVAAPKEEMIFAAGQRTDTGFTLPDGADAKGSSILVASYDICGTKEGLKKDSKATTVPLAEVKGIPAQAPAEVAEKPAKKPVAAAAPVDVEEPAQADGTRRMLRA